MNDTLTPTQRSERMSRIRGKDTKPEMAGDRERSTPIDLLVYDQEIRSLRSYNVKRGNGSYDGVKRRSIQSDLLRTNMLLKDYGEKAGLSPLDWSANIIFYYGILSLPKPLAIAGSELDAHFAFPVIEAIEEVNAYFTQRLHRLIEDE